MVHSEKRVFIVYGMDAEGPLYESLQATFERIGERFGVWLEPEASLLKDLQEGRFPPEVQECVRGREVALQSLISPDRLDFANNWGELEVRSREFLSAAHRSSVPDSYGNGLVLSWFCVDRLGMDDNPRRRAIGYHHVVEFYQRLIRELPGSGRDEIYWHYHPISFTRQAHMCANNFNFTNHHLQVLSHRVLDLGDFPVAFRAGCDVERPDINLFLEQWIPFDYGNVNGTETEAEKGQVDIRGGRFGDWRRAPMDWGTYHPSLLDYQTPGDLNRYIARCRYSEGRVNRITEEEVEQAFLQASTTGRALLSVMSHDHRRPQSESTQFMNMVAVAAAAHPDVSFEYVNARAGIQKYESLDSGRNPVLDLRLEDGTLWVQTDEDMWGAQPFLCFRTHSNDYWHDNFDYHRDGLYSYTFDYLTVELSALDRIGVAANGKNGGTTVHRLSLRSSAVVTMEEI